VLAYVGNAYEITLLKGIYLLLSPLSPLSPCPIVVIVVVAAAVEGGTLTSRPPAVTQHRMGHLQTPGPG
jgi:hypothetical protein